MSHDIHQMAYVGEEPWHGLGTQLPTNSTYAEVVQAAGFYTAVERSLYAPPMEEPIPDRKGLFRSDTGEYLATVHKDYEVVQFDEVARTLVEAAGSVGCIFHTAGTLGRNGVRGWLLGELPEPLRIRGDKSPIRRYVLGYTGHDGTTAITLKNVATRVVCQNTIGVALHEKDGAEWHIPHFDNAKQRLEEAGRAFRELMESYARFGDLANRLAATPFSEEQLRRVLDVVLPLPEDEGNHPRILHAREKVVELYHVGAGIEGDMQATAWAALQAVAEYADHHRLTRAVQGRRVDAMRLESIWMGKAASMKRQALTAILSESQLRLVA
ncbi:DUF932 domain-containing protein [Myxococcus fulvus]|uniref:DUF932 domain-containing protein n=1 Tax=Myxococcus fulvus TaxID=33 RepID=UPI0020BE8434|nr:DUF932 domain-containing protein [Myxococcus fulvus]MCK8504231.1 DUF932 domain-containing protein [Myxococcus fulvus]